ncbi:hypothetical protein B0H10DRAFT_1960580 [Mycena sp. CBHHK59/15]|nr:hypothetical protein B0H10DRAFT_1960580 [Mycena sp. CBHHK59/15]
MSNASKYSLISSPTSAIAILPGHPIPPPPTSDRIIETPLPLQDPANQVEQARVALHDENHVFHVELWRSREFPPVVLYENFGMLEVYGLNLNPLARRIRVFDEEGRAHTEYEAIIPAYNQVKATRKHFSVPEGTEPIFSGDTHRMTYRKAQSADYWCTAYITSPDHQFFTIHSQLSRHSIRTGTKLQSPSTWGSTVVVIEKSWERLGWIGLECCLESTGATIFVKVLSEYVAIDRTWYGKAARWIRIRARKMMKTYDEAK